eukprot:403368799
MQGLNQKHTLKLQKLKHLGQSYGLVNMKGAIKIQDDFQSLKQTISQMQQNKQQFDLSESRYHQNNNLQDKNIERKQNLIQLPSIKKHSTIPIDNNYQNMSTNFSMEKKRYSEHSTKAQERTLSESQLQQNQYQISNLKNNYNIQQHNNNSSIIIQSSQKLQGKDSNFYIGSQIEDQSLSQIGGINDYTSSTKNIQNSLLMKNRFDNNHSSTDQSSKMNQVLSNPIIQPKIKMRNQAGQKYNSLQRPPIGLIQNDYEDAVDTVKNYYESPTQSRQGHYKLKYERNQLQSLNNSALIQHYESKLDTFRQRYKYDLKINNRKSKASIAQIPNYQNSSLEYLQIQLWKINVPVSQSKQVQMGCKSTINKQSSQNLVNDHTMNTLNISSQLNINQSQITLNQSATQAHQMSQISLLGKQSQSTKNITHLYIALVPTQGEKFNHIKIKKVTIKSQNISKCNIEDFLNMTKQIFKVNFEPKYLFDQNGEMITDLINIAQNEFIFVKKTPDFELDEKSMRNVYRKIIKMKGFLKPEASSNQQNNRSQNIESVNKNLSQSPTKILVTQFNEEVENTVTLEPRRAVEDYEVDDKLKKVAPKVAEHDEELMNLRQNLGQSLRKIILGQTKQLTLNVDQDLLKKHQAIDLSSQSELTSEIKPALPLSFLSLLKIGMQNQSTSQIEQRKDSLDLNNLDRTSIQIDSNYNDRKLSHDQNHSEFSIMKKLESAVESKITNFKKNQNSSPSKIEVKAINEPIIFPKDDENLSKQDKLSLLKQVISKQIFKNQSKVPFDQYKVVMKQKENESKNGVSTSVIQGLDTGEIEGKLSMGKGRKIKSKWGNKKGENIRNYIKENAFNTSDFEEKVQKYIRDKFQGPFNLNIPQLKEEMKMKRGEIIGHFSKFLAMLWYKAMQNREAVAQDPAKYLVGIDFDMFKNGAPQLLMENQHVIERMIESALIDSDNKMNNTLSMQDFLKCISTISSTNFEEKINLFFKIIDTDGNGLLSWDEVFELCQASLQDFQTGSNDDFIDDQAKFFADFIFKSVGYQNDEEIPMIELQKVILNGDSSETELLTMFCGIDNFDNKQKN